jgi:hypothetical protein
LDANGLATYSTTLLPHGSTTITAQYISDGNFLPSTNSVVQVVDTPPVAGAHYLGAIMNMTLTISASALAVLDYDADGDTLSITAVSGASTNSPSGNVTLSGGNVHYTPAAGFVGADQFTYTISAPSPGTVNLRGHGIPGHPYDVQRSPDLSTWSTISLTPVIAAANGIILYTDNEAPATAYYRFAVQLDN